MSGAAASSLHAAKTSRASVGRQHSAERSTAQSTRCTMRSCAVIDEDLSALQRFLSDMAPDAPINIGPFRCSAIELFRVAVDAQNFRAERKVMRNPNLGCIADNGP